MEESGSYPLLQMPHQGVTDKYGIVAVSFSNSDNLNDKEKTITITWISWHTVALISSAYDYIKASEDLRPQFFC